MDSPEEKIALGSVIHNSENDSKGGNIPMEEKYAQDMTSARITRSYVKMISQSVNSNSTDIKFRKKIKLSNDTCKFCSQSTENTKYNVKTDSFFSNAIPERQGIKYVHKIEDSDNDETVFKLTNFVIHCKNGHLVSLESDLLEQSKLFFTGVLIPILDEMPIKSNEIKIISEQPICEWFISGFDGGELCLIGITTSYGYYYLLNPLPVYKEYIQGILYKGEVTKLVVEYVLDYGYLDPSYEDMCTFVDSQPKYLSNNKKIIIDDVINNGKFICKQIYHIDNEEQNEFMLSDISCVRTLAKLSGVSLSNICRSNTPHSLKQLKKMRKTVTTPAVHEVFNSFISSINAHMDFSKCDEQKVNHSKIVKWNCDGTAYKDAFYYKSIKIGTIILNSGDCVLLKSFNGKENIIACITYFFEKACIKRFHCQFFARNCDIILQEAGNSREIFLTDICQTLDLKLIIKKVSVIFKESWNNDYLNQDRIESININNSDLFYSKLYQEESGSFINADNIIKLNKNSDFECIICNMRDLKPKPVLINDSTILWNEERYSTGDFVILECRMQSQNRNSDASQNKVNDFCDENLYTEFFRKSDVPHESSSSQPLQIGYIKSILQKTRKSDSGSEIWLKLLKMYRPENITGGIEYKFEVNEIIWSYEEFDTKATNIYKKCYISYIKNLPQNPDEWVAAGPLRFYFIKMLNDKYEMNEVSGFCLQIQSLQAPLYAKLKKRMSTLDIFCGAGGFSEGLKASGLSETKWAIEIDKFAALAIQKNNPGATVYNEDCNSVLETLLQGGTHSNENLLLPKKGEVELLIAGPPCQGFSSINRFSNTDVAQLSNFLIANCLSFVDFYRPRFFILENVRAFVTHEKGITLKLTLSCLLSFGYQCRFAILQAAYYGVPQSRRRLFIIAAAPNEKLPTFPDPENSFSLKSTSLIIHIDGKQYSHSNLLRISAPYRTITIKDAISDLSDMCQEYADEHDIVEKTFYKTDPISYYQRTARKNNKFEYVLDHVAKHQNMVNKARIRSIPCHAGADWRDLPNIAFVCEDGTQLEILQYKYEIQTNTGLQKRGVCACSMGGKCSKEDYQLNTFIPWFLPHTAKRNNNWAGLFGRLCWNDVFSTIITSPEPTGKQGRVLHPSADRVISIRECARSQGFPDEYEFSGNISDRYRQIGNAVPPPVATAIGREVIKVVL